MPDSPFDSYELYYLNTSLFVHSTSASVWTAMDDVDHFTIQPRETNGYRGKILVLSNLFMWNLLFHFNDRYQFGLAEALRDIQLLFHTVGERSESGRE